MDFLDYVTLVRRRLPIVLVVVVACVIGAYAATRAQTKTYQTQTRLIVNAISGIPKNFGISGSQLAAERALSFSQLATTSPAISAALRQAAADAGPLGPGSPEVSATANGNDPFVTITVKDTNPRQAQAVANAFVQILPRISNELDQTKAANASALTTVEVAPLPQSPVSPRPTRNILEGLALGLVLGLGAAVLRESADRRLRGAVDVEDTSGVPLLGAVPSQHRKHRIPVISHPMSARSEAYRTVRTNLAFAGAGGMPKSVLVTSAIAGEGKTTLAINLAVACGRTGQSVALIDADFRRPMVVDYLDVRARRGLTDVVTGNVTLEEAMVATDSGRVHVLSSGPMPTNPSEVLGSTAMVSLLEQLQASYDVIIVDAPPVLAFADALVLAAQIEAVVLVAKVGNTNRLRLQDAKASLVNVNANVAGVVANAASAQQDAAYGYGTGYRNRGRRLMPWSGRARAPEVDVDVKPGEPVIARQAGSEGGYGFFSADQGTARKAARRRR